MKTGFEVGFPTAQNVIDLFPTWTSRFPAALGVESGPLDLFNDIRIVWALEKYGSDLAGKKVLELGPLEGAHTEALTRVGALVDAVEGSRTNYVRCLITKELLQIQNARFHLGDIIQWTEKAPRRYDLVIACGVLYHMDDPLRLLRALAKVTDDLFVWTHYIDEPATVPTKTDSLDGLNVRTYGIPYGPKDDGFTGGPPAVAYWMNKSDIPAVLERLGFDSIEITHDRPKGADNAPGAFSLYARRTRAGADPSLT